MEFFAPAWKREQDNVSLDGLYCLTLLTNFFYHGRLFGLVARVRPIRSDARLRERSEKRKQIVPLRNETAEKRRIITEKTDNLLVRVNEHKITRESLWLSNIIHYFDPPLRWNNFVQIMLEFVKYIWDDRKYTYIVLVMIPSEKRYASIIAISGHSR